MQNIEIVAIGDEVLRGATVNTNAAFMSQQLIQAGFNPCRHTVLPDEKEALALGLREALARSGLVIACGGLGPTCDDHTRQVAAEIFDSPFAYNEVLAADLISRYGNTLLSLEDQATMPVKAEYLKNTVGTAVGLVFSSDKGKLILLPGVPQEMQAMVQKALLPYLNNIFSASLAHACKTVHFHSLRESDVDPRLRLLQERFPSMSFGIYPKPGHLSVQLKSSLSRINDLNVAFFELKEAFYDYYFEAESGCLEEAIFKLFTSKGITLSTAESCTGGAIAAQLVKWAGASAYFCGGVVAYSNALKERFLAVSPQTLKQYGAVSEETVKEMLEGSLLATESDWAIAVSGIAGPGGGTLEKPEGCFCVGIAKPGQIVGLWTWQIQGDRQMRIEKATNRLLGELYRLVRTE